MALGAVLAAALTDHSARSYALWVDGLDVLEQPGGRAYGVTVETVDLLVNGAGGVSSLSFTIDDPTLIVTVTDGQLVRFMDLTNDAPLFTGWIDHFAIMPAFGMQGRSIEVTCIGVEALLDWLVTGYDLTIGAGASLAYMKDAIQTVVSSVAEIGALRYNYSADVQGSQASPVGYLENANNSRDNATFQTYTIPAGTTLRAAILIVLSSGTWTINGPGDFPGGNVTIDPTFGLRVYRDDLAYGAPDSFADIAIGGAVKGAGIRYEVDATGIVRSVLVKGTGVSAPVSDGTGKRGKTAVLTDLTLLTVTACQMAGRLYLNAFRRGIRGAVRLEDTTWGADSVLRHLVLTDPPTGGGTFWVGSARIAFYGPKRDVTFTFGGLAPSGAALMRRLTRDTLS